MARRRSKKPGLPPGTLVAPSDAYVPERMHVIRYTADALDEHDVRSLAELPQAADAQAPTGINQAPTWPSQAPTWPSQAPTWLSQAITWINIDGIGNVDMIRDVGQAYDLHPLALEDALHVAQRPKVEDYDTHLFAVIRMLHLGAQVETEQVGIFLTKNAVITIQERPGDCLDPVRQRLRKSTGLIRKQPPDYLMYAILDAVIDHYFPFLEQIGEVIEHLEDAVVEQPAHRTLTRIHDVKRNLLGARRAIWPLRDAINTLVRDETPLVHKPTRLYLRDCYDHTVQVLDIIETDRELAAGLMDVYLSSVSNKMNEVMKILTIIATIFIPLTFLAGVYGMNFHYMPELRWPWSYPIVWAIMLILAITMLILFRRKGWLGRPKD
jgi:magnesium transporter